MTNILFVVVVLLKYIKSKIKAITVALINSIYY